MGEYQGRILHVDLTSGRVWDEAITLATIQRHLGSRGINADILWRSIKPGIDALGAENVLIFGTGTLTGARAPSSGRTTVTCKSPATGLYLKTSAGGKWGAVLKFAGYNHLVVHGRASRPAIIDITEDEVRIVPARHLWGLDVRETTEALQEEAGDRKVEVACIGPAGENLVKMAALMMSTYSAAGRGGAGAVMGSKNLADDDVERCGRIASSSRGVRHTRVCLSWVPTPSCTRLKL